MTKVLNPCTYQLFDRVLVSDVPLGLLKRINGSGKPASLTVHLQFGSETLEPDSLSITMDTAASADGVPDDDPSKFDFGTLGFIATVEQNGLVITVNRKPGFSHPPSVAELERLGDRLVTTVLLKLPALWGTPALHGAMVGWERASIVIVGESGAGKSTLSQELAKHQRAKIYDDDSTMPLSTGDVLSAVPMGAASRIRFDVAERLGYTGRALFGYVGDKVALPHVGHSSPTPPLVAIFELNPQSEDASGNGVNSIQTDRVTPVEAIPMIWKHIQTINTSQAQSALRFSLAHQLSALPMYKVTYAQGIHTPHDVATALMMRTMQK